MKEIRIRKEKRVPATKNFRRLTEGGCALGNLQSVPWLSLASIYGERWKEGESEGGNHGEITDRSSMLGTNAMA